MEFIVIFVDSLYISRRISRRPNERCVSRVTNDTRTQGRGTGLMSSANAAVGRQEDNFRARPLPSRHYALETIPQPL